MKVLVDCTLQIKAFDEYIWLCYKCLQNWDSFSSCILNVLSKLCTYYSFRAKFCHSVNHPAINIKIDFFWDHADNKYFYCQLSTSRYFIQKKLKRFMSIFCKRRGADDFFLMVNLPEVSVFTFYLFWIKAPLSQHRPELLCSKVEIQISHEN